MREHLRHLHELYDELGEPVEELFANTDNFLSETKKKCLLDRLRVVEELRVEFHFGCAIQDNRKKSIGEMMERLHHYYDSLGISLENTDNDVDRVVLSTQVHVPIIISLQDIPVKTNIMNQITDRINKLEQLIVYLSISHYRQERRQNTISAYNAEISNL